MAQEFLNTTNPRKRFRLQYVAPVKQPEKLRADDVIIAIMKLGFFILILGTLLGVAWGLLGPFGIIVGVIGILHIVSMALGKARP